MHQERRQHTRYLYPVEPLGFDVRILWASAPEYNPEDIEFIDISRAGLGIISNNVFSVGDTLKLQVMLGESEIPTLVAVVCNRRPFDRSVTGSSILRGQLFRYGLFFEIDSDGDDSVCQQMLTQLESLIRRQQECL